MSITQEQAQYKKYRRSQVAELADWTPGFDMSGVSVSDADKAAGSPKLGDKIARNPVNHADRWLVAADYFAANFEPIQQSPQAAPVQAQQAADVVPYGGTITAGHGALIVKVNADGTLSAAATQPQQAKEER